MVGTATATFIRQPLAAPAMQLMQWKQWWPVQPRLPWTLELA